MLDAMQLESAMEVTSALLLVHVQLSTCALYSLYCIEVGLRKTVGEAVANAQLHRLKCLSRFQHVLPCV